MAVSLSHTQRMALLASIAFLTLSLAFGMGYLAGKDSSRAPIEITTCQ